jgi:hypothetical protein
MREWTCFIAQIHTSKPIVTGYQKENTGSRQAHLA